LTGIRQPTLSQQLGVLRNEGLVATRRDGKWIYYSVASREAKTMLATLHTLFCPDYGRRTIAFEEDERAH
jgi:DNA-binding transcriptional ArsR family regulator